MKVAAQVTGLFVAGLILLAGFGVVVEVRIGNKPAEPAIGVQATQVPGETAATSVDKLRTGALKSLRRAKTHLKNDERSSATHAIDAAHRTLIVGMSAARAPDTKAFRQAEHAVKATRHALQMGAPDKAEKNLSAAIRQLTGARVSGGGAPPSNPDRFEGGTVIRPDGIRIGEFEGIEEGTGGTTAILTLGGHPDFLGFIDLGGGKTARVPVNELLFGKDKWLGMSMVVYE